MNESYEVKPVAEVRNPASLVNHESLIDEDAIGCTRPSEPVYKNPGERDDKERDAPMVDDALVERPWKYTVDVVADDAA